MEKLLIVTGSDSVEAAIRQRFTYPKMELVVLKNGSRGSALYRRDGSRERIGVYKITQTDATGAGDCYCGSLCVALSEGKSLEEAAEFATKASALAVQKAGAQVAMPYREEL